MKDRIAIITGASSGIGRAISLRLAGQGVKLILNARTEKTLQTTCAEIHQQVNAAVAGIVYGDTADPSVTEQCIEECRRLWGRGPDIFLLSAGRGLPGTVTTSDHTQWDDLINTNIKGVLHQMRSIARAMMEQASSGRDFVTDPQDIVVIGSSIGRNVSPFNSVYGATKFATHGLTEALRRELGPKGIRVTLIEPGLVSTNFQRSAGYDQEWFDGYAREVGPILGADDVAKVIEFLLSLPGNIHLDNVSIRPTRQAYP
jgi:NADP-dependent 3-hydroxy acid dehydrogenase YdfG